MPRLSLVSQETQPSKSHQLWIPSVTFTAKQTLICLYFKIVIGKSITHVLLFHIKLKKKKTLNSFRLNHEYYMPKPRIKKQTNKSPGKCNAAKIHSPFKNQR